MPKSIRTKCMIAKGVKKLLETVSFGEISVEEIEEQKNRFLEVFKDNPKAVFIDTTVNSIDKCVDIMLKKNNDVMRGRRKW